MQTNNPTQFQIPRVAHKHEATAAEISVLGGILLDNAAVDRVRPIIDAGEFSSPVHAEIYKICVEMSDAGGGEAIDPITLATEMDHRGRLEALGGVEYLLQIAASTVTSVNIEHHANLIHDAAEVRRMMKADEERLRQAQMGQIRTAEEYRAAADGSYSAMEESRKTGRIEYTLRNTAIGVLENIQAIYEGRAPDIGVPSGFEKVDELIGTYRPGKFIVLGARPAMGKSAKALADAYNIAAGKNANGTPNGCGPRTAIFITLEMPADECVERLISSRARVESEKMRTGNLTDKEVDAVVKAAADLRDIPLIINDDPYQTIASIRAFARRVASNKKIPPLGIMFVDYLQLVKGNTRNGANREQEIASISRGLKLLSKELGIPIVALSQVKRDVETRTNKRPMTSDLRESGAVEQDADVVQFVYRDEVYDENSEDKGIAEIITTKNRGGRIGTAKIAWNGRYTQFQDLHPGAAYGREE